MAKAKANLWSRQKVRGDLTYTREYGDWKIIRVKGSQSGWQYQIFYSGEDPYLSQGYRDEDSLKGAKDCVEYWIGQAKNALAQNPGRRAHLALEAGNQAEVLSCVFEYIDKKFDELEEKMDDKLRSLSISM